MAERNAITAAGLGIIAAAQAGTIPRVKFTSVRAGSGSHAASEDLSALMGLAAEKARFAVSDVTALGSDTVQIGALLSNAGVSTGFRITEVGVYAEDAGGQEVLYAIFTKGAAEADFLPANTAGNESSIYYRCNVAVSNAAQVTAADDHSAYAHVTDLNALKARVQALELVPTAWEVTLRAAAWSASAPYTQEVVLPGCKAMDVLELGKAIAKTGSIEAAKAARKWLGAIDGGESKDGKAVLFCTIKKPTEDFKVKVRRIAGNG